MSDSDSENEKIIITPYISKMPDIKKILNNKIPAMIPKLPIISSVIARTNSGKSVIICSLIADYYIPLGIFREQDVFYFSPSINIDDTYKKLPNGVRRFETYDEGYILGIINEMKDKIQTHGKFNVPQILFVFDDMISEHSENGRTAFHNNSVLSKLFTRGRHWNINTFVTSQKYTSLSRTIRVNSLQVILLNMNEGELETVLDDWASKNKKKSFYAMMDRIFNVGNPYASLYINTTEKDVKKRYIVNFDYYEHY